MSLGETARTTTQSYGEVQTLPDIVKVRVGEPIPLRFGLADLMSLPADGVLAQQFEVDGLGDRLKHGVIRVSRAKYAKKSSQSDVLTPSGPLGLPKGAVRQDSFEAVDAEHLPYAVASYVFDLTGDEWNHAWLTMRFKGDRNTSHYEDYTGLKSPKVEDPLAKDVTLIADEWLDFDNSLNPVHYTAQRPEVLANGSVSIIPGYYKDDNSRRVVDIATSH